MSPAFHFSIYGHLTPIQVQLAAMRTFGIIAHRYFKNARNPPLPAAQDDNKDAEITA
jgi:hypothetical protein